MNYTKRLLVNIPDQVLSTFVMWGFVMVAMRGVTSIVKNPPSITTITVILVIGVVMGCLAAVPNKKSTATPNEAPK